MCLPFTVETGVGILIGAIVLFSPRVGLAVGDGVASISPTVGLAVVNEAELIPPVVGLAVGNGVALFSPRMELAVGDGVASFPDVVSSSPEVRLSGVFQAPAGYRSIVVAETPSQE